MITDIQKLPSGFYAVWRVDGRDKTLVDASSSTFEQAWLIAMGCHKGFSFRRAYLVLEDAPAIVLQQCGSRRRISNGIT